MADDLLPLLGIGIVGQEDSDDDELESDTSSEEDDHRGQNNGSQEERKRSIRIRQESFTFDPSLPSAHSYLGNDLEEVRGRTIHDEDSQVTLPVIQLPGMVLVPGQTIPLHLFHQHTVAMLKSVVDSDKTFGIVAYRYEDSEGGHTMATIGTTAEIYSVKDETDDTTGLSSIRVKAKGRQRFEIIESRRTATGILMATVKILTEKVMPDFLEGARPPSHCKFCCNPSDQDNVVKTAVNRQGQVIANVAMVNNRQVNRFTAAYYTWWPPWVYKMYDPETVMRNVKEELQKWNESYKPERMPNNPIELSYWVSQNLPLDDRMRLNLLIIDNAIQRLRCSLSIMQKCSILCCKDCETQIASKNDVFSLSVEGPLGAFVNPGGYVHETMTVYKAQNLNLIGRPSKEHSWFPEYAWTIAQCRRCSFHLGWKFTATKKHMIPQKFYGLTRASVVPGIQHLDESGDEWMPVM